MKTKLIQFFIHGHGALVLLFLAAGCGATTPAAGCENQLELCKASEFYETQQECESFWNSVSDETVRNVTLECMAAATSCEAAEMCPTQ